MPIDNDKIYDKLMVFHSEFTEFRGDMKARVAHVEKEIESARTWENVKIFCILPVTAGLHSLASRLGLLKG